MEHKIFLPYENFESLDLQRFLADLDKTGQRKIFESASMHGIRSRLNRVGGRFLANRGPGIFQFLVVTPRFLP